jgi:3-carboxy-cis,cis-muconate cycloisomerase
MTVSPFENSLLSGLLGDAEAVSLFSVDAELGGMIAFERALAEAEGAEGVIPPAAAKTICDAIGAIGIDVAKLTASTATDGVAVPELVRQLRAGLPADVREFVHFGATSQDVVDTSLALRLKHLSEMLKARLDELITEFDALDARDGALSVMAHTRMQAAIPVTASRKIMSWRDPLARHRERLAEAVAGIAQLQFGGAAGTLEKLGPKGAAVAARMAARLGLAAPARPWHSERDGVAAFASWLSLVSGSLGKFGQDVALLAQNEVGEIKLSAGGGSSAMPHKVNPVGAEVLVTLARFNATLLSGMHQSLVHESERSGAAWSLEWMLLPQMATATAAGLRTACKLVPEISFRQKA